MEIERFQHIEVNEHVVDQGERLRVDRIDVEDDILVLYGLRNELFVFLLLPLVFTMLVALLAELFEQTSDLMFTQWYVVPVRVDHN